MLVVVNNFKFFTVNCNRTGMCFWCNKPVPEGWQNYCSMKFWNEAGKPDIIK